MLDTKKIIQLGLGVAIGMIAWHFIQQQMNKSALVGETASARGRKRSRSLSGSSNPTTEKGGGCPTVMCNTYDNAGNVTNVRYVKCCQADGSNCCMNVMK